MIQKQRKQAASAHCVTDEEPEAKRAQQIEHFWQIIDRIQERNADKDPDEELAFITSVVEEVRQERYDATRAKPEGRRR